MASTSSKRYFATLLYILQWYDKDMTNPSSKGYQVTMGVWQGVAMDSLKYR
jgi:hypothetical protein